ncbi:unnamed protein product, partial [Callosobruchus maculatus]
NLSFNSLSIQLPLPTCLSHQLFIQPCGRSTRRYNNTDSMFCPVAVLRLIQCVSFHLDYIETLQL